MDEDRLTPRLGRLIDEAKAAARRAAPGAARREGVALLTADGSIFTGSAESAETGAGASAAGSAQAAAAGAGQTRIEAAAIAVAEDPAETVLPGRGSRAVLAAIDPDLPVVFKQRGRWVLFPLSQLPSRG